MKYFQFFVFISSIAWRIIKSWMWAVNHVFTIMRVIQQSQHKYNTTIILLSYQNHTTIISQSYYNNMFLTILPQHTTVIPQSIDKVTLFCTYNFFFYTQSKNISILKNCGGQKYFSENLFGTFNIYEILSVALFLLWKIRIFSKATF